MSSSGGIDRAAVMGTGSIPRLLAKFSWPAIVGALVHATYNVVDRIYLGHAVGPIGIAATSVAFPLMLILMAFGMLIAHGSNALISIRLGERRPEEAEHILGQAITLLCILSATFMVGGLIFLKPLLILFGATSTVLPAATEYMQIILIGVFTHEISFAVNNFIRGEGNPHTAMLTMLIGAGLNLVLDPIFIFGFGWGMRGAALATVLAQTVSAAWVLWYFLGGRSQLKIRLRHLRLVWATVRDIAAVGSPPFAMQMASCLLMTVLNNQLRRYGGDLAISAMGIVFSCNMIFFMPVIGICMGMQPIVGYNYGARDYARVRQCMGLAMRIATLLCLAGFIAVEFFPAQLVGLFGKNEPDLVALGSHAMRWYMLMIPAIGFQMVGSQYFQAVGKPRIAMLLTLSRQVIILLPLLVILPPHLGLDGIWFAGPIADGTSALLTGLFVWREMARLTAAHGPGATASEPLPAAEA